MTTGARHDYPFPLPDAGDSDGSQDSLSGKTTKGRVWLRAVLTEATRANARGTTGYLGAQFRRLARRRGRLKALVAVAHSLIVSICHVLREHRPHADLGPDYFATLEAERVERHHVRCLSAPGDSVTLTPLPPAGPVPARGPGTGLSREYLRRGTVKLRLLGTDGGPKVGNDRRIGDRIRPVQARATVRTGSAWGDFVQSKLNVTIPDSRHVLPS